MADRARIYRKPKSAMQSGVANAQAWVIEFVSASPPRPDPLMGWIGQADTQSQVVLQFDTKEEAVAYADKHGLRYEVELPHERTFRPKAYADNFKFGRIENWTH
ncbi:MAG: ETC complex I subunit [Acetobacteraceae bacterium]|nr:ETC complex I subunit [Acetobacteraceae bacterium]